MLGLLSAGARQRLLARLTAPKAPHASDRRDRLRPILAAALSLLGWSLPAKEFEALLTRWLAREAADALDWTSPEALADVVLMAVRFAIEV